MILPGHPKHVQIVIRLITCILLLNYGSRRNILIASTLQTPIMNSHDAAKIVASNTNKCAAPSCEHEMECKL